MSKTHIRGDSNLRRAWRRFRANNLALISLAIVVMLALAGIFAPQIATHVTGVGPDKQSLLHNFEGASADHWLGTDEYGRDVFTRLIYGLRVSLMVAGLATFVTVIVGTLVGLVAAFYGGWVDQVLMRFVDVMLAIPAMSLLLLLGAMFTVGPVALAVMIALIAWYPLARLVRSETLAVRQKEYVEAARTMGASPGRILGRHLLPNVSHLVIIYATGAIPGFLLTEAGLSFLGLGVRPPTPSLGTMLNGSTQYLYKRPELILYPGLVITVIALTVTIVGNALRDALDPQAN